MYKRQIEFLDAVDQPALGNRSSHYAALRSIRLWARDGLVTESEAAFVNDSIDAIMIHSRLDVAVNVQSWFRGTVFYRHFGDISSIIPDQRFDSERANLSRIIHVPILQSLLNDAFARRFNQSLILRSSMILPPVAHAVSADGHGSVRVGLFVALLDDLAQVFINITKLARSSPDVEIDVFGLNLNDVSEIPVLPSNVVIVPRLNDLDYWARFRSLKLVVYPHENPRHSHYIPYESVALGIPCLVTRASAIANDFAACGIGEDESNGIFPTVPAILDAVPRLVNSDQALAAIAYLQSPVLEAFSADAIRCEATQLVAAVTSSRQYIDSDPSQAAPIEPWLTIPASIVRGDLEHFQKTGCLVINPATIAASTTLGFGISGEVVFGDADGPVLDFFPGVSNQLRLGKPAFYHAESITCRLSVRTRNTHEWPAAVFVSKSGEFVQFVFSREFRTLPNGDVCWDAFITISPPDEVVVAVMNDDILDRLRVVEVELKVLTEMQWLQEIVSQLRHEVVSLTTAAATADNDRMLALGERDRAIANRDRVIIDLASTETELRSTQDWANGLERELLAPSDRRTGWLRTRLRRYFSTRK